MAQPTHDQDTAVRVRARHRSTRGVHRPAAMVTAGIAATAVALAAFAGVGSPIEESAEAAPPVVNADHVNLGVNQTSLAGVDGTVDALRDSVQTRQLDLGTVRIERIEQGNKAVDASLAVVDDSAASVRSASAEIAEERAEAERLEAERLEAERLEAERLEAERLEAERAAAEQLEADRRATEQAAARSQEREEPPVQETPAPPPASTPSPGGAKATARSMLSSYGWGDDQWGCLESLWERESNWNHTAMNPSSGAYGIPQSLPGNKMASSGADWQTNPTTQITWGLGYIQGRYGTPCGAWAHSQSVGWY